MSKLHIRSNDTCWELNQGYLVWVRRNSYWKLLKGDVKHDNHVRPPNQRSSRPIKWNNCFPVSVELTKYYLKGTSTKWRTKKRGREAIMITLLPPIRHDRLAQLNNYSWVLGGDKIHNNYERSLIIIVGVSLSSIWFKNVFWTILLLLHWWLSLLNDDRAVGPLSKQFFNLYVYLFRCRLSFT